MSSDDALCTSLIKWVATFRLNPEECKTAEQLTSGVILADALGIIDNTFFDEEWREKIKQTEFVDWRLKASNLKKITKAMYSYYSDVLGQQLLDFEAPDENLIAEYADERELYKLLQLVLGCAINCSHKEEYISTIMSLEEDVQRHVMNSLQQLLSPTAATPCQDMGGAPGEVEAQLKEAWDEVQRLTGENEQLTHRCLESEMIANALKEDNEALLCRAQASLSGADKAAAAEEIVNIAGKRYKQLQDQLDDVTHENYLLEAARDDYKTRADQQEAEILDLQEKVTELSSLAEQASSLRDEVDVLKSNTEKIIKLEAALDISKKRLEEMSDLKRQLKLLEEKNSSYMNTNFQLEEEVKKLLAQRQQMETYRQQAQKTETSLARETRRADKSQFELDKLTEKLNQLTLEKERLVLERDSLKETNDELSSSTITPAGAEDLRSISESPMLEVLPANVREKLTRLQHENKMLRIKVDAAGREDSSMLRTLLEDEQRRKSELETECRITHQKVLELESRLQDTQQLLEQSNSADAFSEQIQLRKQLHDYMDQVKRLETELDRKKSHIDILESRLQEANEKVKHVTEQLLKKEQDMKLTEERYKKYLEKAKSVIKALDPRCHPTVTPDVELLKNQLREKQHIIDNLEREHAKSRVCRDQEERLMVSAWYNMGTQLHHKAAENRLSSSSAVGGGGGQSFLSRQRHMGHYQHPGMYNSSLHGLDPQYPAWSSATTWTEHQPMSEPQSFMLSGLPQPTTGPLESESYWTHSYHQQFQPANRILYNADNTKTL